MKSKLTETQIGPEVDVRQELPMRRTSSEDLGVTDEEQSPNMMRPDASRRVRINVSYPHSIAADMKVVTSANDEPLRGGDLHKGLNSTLFQRPTMDTCTKHNPSGFIISTRKRAICLGQKMP